MNSCLYKARVFHHRLQPKQHRFDYTVFMFYLDLDELPALHRQLRFMSHNRFNLFNFRDRDHLQWPAGNPDQSKPVKEHLRNFLAEKGFTLGNGRVMVLTNLATLGYQFNPVSFYFCYDEQGVPRCSVVEVSNTFHEMKPYYLSPESFRDGRFVHQIDKYFYVSPFIDLDTRFEFDLGVPGEELAVRIDDYSRDGERFFLSTLRGKRASLTDANLLLYFFSFPLITLKVISMIHWQAFRLWLKKLPFHRKADDAELQRDVLRPYRP